jgi:hypothetical protein
LSEKSFYRWRAREKESIAAEKSSLTLVPISFGAGVPATSDVVRIHSPGGWRIELPATNAPWLTDLLRQLP